MGSVSCPTCDLERLGSEEVVQVYGFCTHMLYHWIMELCAYGCNSASSGTNPMFIGQSIQEIWLHKVTHAHLNHKTMVKFTYLAIAPILLNGDVTSCEHFQKSGHDSTLHSCAKGVSISPISEAWSWTWLYCVFTWQRRRRRSGWSGQGRTTFQWIVGLVLRLQRQSEDEMIVPGVLRKLAFGGFALRVCVSRI